MPYRPVHLTDVRVSGRDAQAVFFVSAASRPPSIGSGSSQASYDTHVLALGGPVRPTKGPMMPWDDSFAFRHCPWFGVRDAHMTSLHTAITTTPSGRSPRHWGTVACPRCGSLI